MNGGEVARGDARLLEVHVLIFGWLVSLNRVVSSFGVTHQFRIVIGSDRNDTGNSTQRLNGVINDGRGAIFAISGVGGIERKDDEVSGFKTQRLVAKIIERAQEESGAAQQQDAQRDLSTDGKFAKALRIAREGSAVLPHGSTQVGTD